MAEPEMVAQVKGEIISTRQFQRRVVLTRWYYGMILKVVVRHFGFEPGKPLTSSAFGPFERLYWRLVDAQWLGELVIQTLIQL